jgi:hypothetical protein
MSFLGWVVLEGFGFDVDIDIFGGRITTCSVM